MKAKPSVTLQVPATEKLISKPVVRVAEPTKAQPLFQETQRKAKTPEHVRERNLQIILIAGVVLLFLAGAVLATTYQKLSRSYYWELIGLFMFGLTIYLLAGVSLLLCLSSLIIVGALGVQSRKDLTAKKLINFGWLSFFLLVEFLVLVPLDKSWGLRLLMIVLLGLFNWGLRQKKVSEALGYLTVSVGILYGVLWVVSSVFIPVFSLVDLYDGARCFWNGAACP